MVWARVAAALGAGAASGSIELRVNSAWPRG
ncbi:hypothetical protein STRAU_2827 [Streptomyces aurantiacus JA 4570]|uniref:Uncharacterized protein n=1 Tax=Streptomyces aurantiacus JA 4570 TaxID=1286094 RepID=S3ZLL2_9ACTN|nr:hypothetical protein STRAU_2827 [Streptomyces aurantiacus JA 4570]